MNCDYSKSRIPTTEMSNIKSENIDIQSPEKIVKIISECESEIFGGYGDSDGIIDDSVVLKCINVAFLIDKAIRDNGFTNIVIIGAGTSGRLCRLIAKIIRQEPYHQKVNIIPIIAGGINALIKAEPNTEDDFEKGLNDYYQYTKDIDKSNCFLFGVSCGLSANYVNGALCGNLENSNLPSVLIGFNPLKQATIDIKTHNNLVIINPIVGPEPIVGSVRMKGGTATLILLKAIISAGLNQENLIPIAFNDIIKTSRKTLDSLYRNNLKIGELINRIGMTLNNNGKIHILGSSVLGSLAIYDAAECSPTFGAFEGQVNGYIGNTTELVYYDNEVTVDLAKGISFDNFIDKWLAETNINDLAICIIDADFPTSIFTKMQSKSLNNLILLYLDNNVKSICCPSIDGYIFHLNCLDIFQKSLFIRSLLLCLSTGGFILNGKVFNNNMIDLRITNKKLFLRALRIISQITGFEESVVEETLLKNIYYAHNLSYNSLSEYIKIASSQSHIVPKTILALFYPEKTYKEIDLMLMRQPVIRKLISNELLKIDSYEVK